MAETLSFPIEIPGAEEAKRDLGAIAGAFERIGVEADAAGRSQHSLGQAMAGSANAAGGLRGALSDVKDRGLEELSQKAGELGQRLGGVTGQIANVAIKSAAAFGGIGIAVTAVGAALAFAAQAWQEYSARLELNNARTEELTNATNTLGAAYPSMTAAVEGATNAVEAHTRALAENQRILGQQLELMNRGFSVEAARSYTVQLQQVSGAVRELGTYLHGASEDQIRQTIESGNATAQQELLGLSFQHSSDATQENANRLAAVSVLQHRAAEAVAAHKDELVTQARAALESARADAAVAAELDDNGTAAASAAQRVQAASEALAQAQDRAAVAHRAAAAGAREASEALDRLGTATEASQAQLDAGYARIAQIAQEREKRKADEEAARRRAAASRPGSDPLEQLKQQIRLNQELMRIEDARAARENTHREHALELARLSTHTEEERRALTERTIRLHGDELREQRALSREQIAGNERLVAAIQRRAASLRGAHLAEANEQIRALHQSTIDITERLAEADHRLSVEAATYAAAERDRLRAIREAADEQRKSKEEEAKGLSADAARQARENDLVIRRQNERLDATQTYQERLAGMYQHEMDLNKTLAESSQVAFTAMGEAFAKHVESVVSGSESVGEALQGYLSDVLGAISKEAYVKSAFYFAQGVGQLAGIATAPLAPASFAAAAGFAAVGALAGVGSAALRPSTPAAASSGGGAGGGGERAASVSRGGSESGGATVYNINFGGPMYGTGGVRQAARQMVGAINRGGIQGGVQLLPGVLQGAGAGA